MVYMWGLLATSVCPLVYMDFNITTHLIVHGKYLVLLLGTWVLPSRIHLSWSHIFYEMEVLTALHVDYQVLIPPLAALHV